MKGHERARVRQARYQPREQTGPELRETERERTRYKTERPGNGKDKAEFRDWMRTRTGWRARYQARLKTWLKVKDWVRSRTVYRWKTQKSPVTKVINAIIKGSQARYMCIVLRGLEYTCAVCWGFYSGDRRTSSSSSPVADREEIDRLLQDGSGELDETELAIKQAMQVAMRI